MLTSLRRLQVKFADVKTACPKVGAALFDFSGNWIFSKEVADTIYRADPLLRMPNKLPANYQMISFRPAKFKCF